MRRFDRNQVVHHQRPDRPSREQRLAQLQLAILGKAGARQVDPARIEPWWRQIDIWRARNSFAYEKTDKLIKPQRAVEALYEKIKDRDPYITTEVGQHQMWAAQLFKFESPNRWMTSGGLGTMGYGLPAAMGAQIAHPGKLVVDIAGEASIMMNIQEMSTLAQYKLPVKIFILNNQWMGMVRQWQELMHGKRYSESYVESLPDFVKLAESFGAVGLKAETPDEMDSLIDEMIAVDRPVIADVRVDPTENVYPMVPSGAAHNEMILGNEAGAESPQATDQGLALV